MEKISIITVTFNAAATLQSTIDSVKTQTYPNVELIIIDGQSKDGTVDIIKQNTQYISYWISEKDNGIYDAMNKGIIAATGDRILFLGADDYLFSKDILSAIFEKNDYISIDFLYGNVQLSSSKKIFGCPKTFLKLLNQNISHQAIFYKKQLLEKKGYFNIKYKVLADYYFNLQVFKDASISTKYIDTIITLFNDKGMSNTNIDVAFFTDLFKQLRVDENMPANTPQLQQYFFYTGFAQFKQGKILTGLYKIGHSIFIGNRKLFFFLVSIKFFLTFIGIGKKIKFI
jgi:glycosyltransferase involved in cell wall biosynthesis